VEVSQYNIARYTPVKRFRRAGKDDEEAGHRQ